MSNYTVTLFYMHTKVLAFVLMHFILVEVF